MDAQGRSPHGWLLGRVRGVPVYLGRSWPIVAIGVVVLFGPTVPLRGSPMARYAVAAAYAILLLLSVLAHEAGHAAMARRVGARVDRVVADLWGGHTVYDSEGVRPGTGALVAVAGPLANVALAGLAWVLGRATTVPVLDLLVAAVLITNVFVAGFNLLPGLPLDGGYLVDALVWRVTGSRGTGMLVAGWCGRLVTVGVAVWFVVLPLLRGEGFSLTGLVWLMLVGGFLWVGASQAVSAGGARRGWERVRVGHVLRPVVVAPAHASGDTVMSGLAATPAARHAVVLGPDRMPVGLVDSEALRAVPPQRLGQVPAMALVRQGGPGWTVVADAGDGADAVMDSIAGAVGSSGQVPQVVLVVDATGAPVGTVSLVDLQRALGGG
ncbi:MAG: M50 family metallopeptidase [Dermatophilaceae bacterium]